MDEWQPSIAVTPTTPERFEHEDFADLARTLFDETGIKPDAIQFRLGYLYGDGPELNDWTPVSFFLDEAGRAALQAVVQAIIDWGREWVRTRKGRKPIKARIYGPNGEILREVEVPRPNDE